jgi:hypothetical protein
VVGFAALRYVAGFCGTEACIGVSFIFGMSQIRISVLRPDILRLLMDFLSPPRTVPGWYLKYTTAASLHIVIRNHVSTIQL